MSSNDNVINCECPTLNKLFTMMSLSIKEIDFKVIDEAYKNWVKDKKEEKKQSLKDKKANVGKGKKNGKKAVDENGVEKPKVLSKYNIFMKECQPKIKEMYPDISNTERLRKVGEEWAKHKEALAATLEKEEVIKEKEEVTNGKDKVTNDNEEVVKEEEEVVKDKEEVVKNKKEVVKGEEEVIKDKKEVVKDEEDFSEITEVPVVEVKKAKKKSNK